MIRFQHIKINLWILVLLPVLSGALFFGCAEQVPPNVVSIEPEFGPEETLITVQGMHFDQLQAIFFDGDVAANFNPSFGTDEALLFRVPEQAPLGENMIKIITEAGQIEIPFRVTLKPPQVSHSYPESANEGDFVTILGENFFEPLEVLFVDSIPGQIIFAQEDSLVVQVPAGVEKGRIKVKANGGFSLTPTVFFSTTEILVNDFDGNGLRAETNKWIFYGNINENSNTAVQNTNPVPIENNYLKVSGVDPGTIWIGGVESHSFDANEFDVFPISSGINDTFLEMDITSNGFDHTYLIIVLAERNGSPNDFTHTINIDNDSWERLKIPLNRFEDIDGFTVDAQKIRTVKLHLFNEASSNQKHEINVDNLKFIQIN